MARRFRRSSLVALLVFLMLIISAALFLRWKNDWVAERIAGVVTRNLLSERGYAFGLEGFSWQFPDELVLDGVSVSYRGELRPAFELLSVRHMELSFDPISILSGDFRSTNLELNGVVLRAFPIESEGWAYPGFDRTPGERSEVVVELGLVSIEDFALLRETEDRIDTLRVDRTRFSLFRNSGGSSLDLEDLSLGHSDLAAFDLSGRFFLNEHGRLTLAGLELGLPNSRLSARGFVDLQAGPDLKVEVETDSLRFDEVAALLRQNIVTDSWLSGPLRVSGRPDSLWLEGRMSGDIYDYSLSEMEFAGAYEDGAFDFDELHGLLNGSRVDGAARIVLPLDGKVLALDGETRVRDFDLATFMGDGLVTRLNGAGKIALADTALSLSLDLVSSSVDQFSFQRARGELTLLGDTLNFAPLLLEDDGLELSVQGRIHPTAERIQLRGEGRSRSSRMARHFSGDSLHEGELDFSLGFAGALLAPHFHLEGSFKDALYLGGDLDRGQLTVTSDSLNFDPFLIHVEAEGIRRSGLDFERLYLDAELVPEELRIRHASLDADQTELLVAGTVDLGALPITAELERLWLRWLGEDWLNDRPLSLSLGDSLGLGPAEWYSSKGRFLLDWRPGDQSPERLELMDLDLAQLAPWIPAGLPLSGRLDAELLQLPDASYSLNARMRGLELDDLPAGELDLAAVWRERKLVADSLSWRLDPERNLRVHGELTGMPDAAEGLGALASVAAESLAAELGIAARSFPLQRLERMRDEPWGLEGELSGAIRLTGPLSAPVTNLAARLDSFHLGRVDLDSIEWMGSLGSGRLVVPRLDISRGDTHLRGSLAIPLEFSLLAKPELVGDGPLEGELQLEGRAEDLLGLTDLLAEAAGQLSGEISLGGSLDVPSPSGRLSLRSGRLRPAGWEEHLEDLDADAVLSGDTLIVSSLKAAEGLKYSRKTEGKLSADGWLTWHGPFRYAGSIKLDEASISTLPFFTGLVSGDLEIATWDEVGIAPHPYVRGEVDILQGVLSYDFQDVGVAGGVTVDPILSYDLRVRAENNLMLENDQTHLELSGELTLSSTPEGEEVNGDLRTLRGYYTVFGNKFYLMEGYLDFSSAEGVNPKVDILAETRTRDDRIQIRISNTFAEPEIELVSEQGYSQEDVLRILAGLPTSDETAAGGALAQTVVLSRVEAELLGRLERLVSGELAGLVDFELENRNLEGEDDMETRWQIGRYLPGGFYISYNQGLSLDSDRELGLEYRLYNRLFLRSEVINRGSQFSEEGLINEYNFDVRLRYDY